MSKRLLPAGNPLQSNLSCSLNGNVLLNVDEAVALAGYWINQTTTEFPQLYEYRTWKWSLWLYAVVSNDSKVKQAVTKASTNRYTPVNATI
jgi:hypothetical protein